MHNHEFNFIIFFLIIKKFKTILHFKKKSLTMNILCATCGYCLEYKKSSKDIMLQKLHIKYFILLRFFKNLYHNGKIMAESIAYIGPILMWWNLNDNGSSFHNILMLRWGICYKIEMKISQILAILISIVLLITFKP